LPVYEIGNNVMYCQSSVHVSARITLRRNTFLFLQVIVL